MAKKAKTVGKKSLYAAIATRSKTVSVNGVDVTLHVPSREVAESVRTARVRLAKNVQNTDAPDLLEAAEYILSVAALCVQACWPEDIAEHDARHMVVISGGEQGTLATCTMRLCGCANDDMEEAELDRPS